MATHKELYTIITDNNLKNRLFTACLIEFDAILAEPANAVNHAIKLIWYERFISASNADNNMTFRKILLLFIAGCKDILLTDIMTITDVMLNIKVHNIITEISKPENNNDINPVYLTKQV